VTSVYVYSMLRLGPAIAGAIVREGHLDPSQVARPAVLLVRTDECLLGISRGCTRGTATRPPNPGQLRELIDQIVVSHLLVHALESTESLP
jgi:hypothetical protein